MLAACKRNGRAQNLLRMPLPHPSACPPPVPGLFTVTTSKLKAQLAAAADGAASGLLELLRTQVRAGGHVLRAARHSCAWLLLGRGALPMAPRGVGRVHG